MPILMSTLKIGLLLDDKFSSKYVYELAHWAQQQPNIEISHLIIHPPPANSIFEKIFNIINKKGFYYFFSVILFRIIISAEKNFLKLNRLHRSHFDIFDLSEKVGKELIIKPIISKSGFAYQFSSNDVSRVKDLNLDLLIRCGSEVMCGEILHVSRLGIISFGNGGNRIYRGGPVGFWECYYRCPKTGFIIQRLTEELDAGEVLLSGFFSTKFSFSLNQANLYRKSSPHFQSLLLQIALSGQLPKAEISRPYSGQLFQSPKLHQSISYIFKIIYRQSIKIFFRSINFRKKWRISFVRSNWKRAVLWRSNSVTVPKGRFWADPFLYVYNDKTYCFFEDYIYKTNRAHISVLEISNDAVVKLGACIKEPFHLSFPFLFNYNGSLYMCPECCKSQQIRIYRCLNFPLSWELSSIAMDGVSAADTMIFEHAERWWMLTSIDKSGSGDYCSELYIFYSNSPLDTDWKAHQKNPIRIDSEGGRNAGLIMEEGKIFRLAQRHGYDEYGEGLLMYEITELSESGYSEQLFSEVNPNFKKGLLGVHHLSTTGAITAFDHVSRTFFP